MRLLFIINPKSGRGKASPLADAFATAATRDGHVVERLVIGTFAGSPSDAAWRGRVAASDVAVVFGGDGTVHTLLPALVGSPTALYHVPMGTENLFARQFAMTRRPDDFRLALRENATHLIDLGEANGRLFAIMCSVGPDASVVRRLAACRTGAIRHTSYAAPIFHEVLRPSLGPFDVRVDGESLVTSARGMLLIANSPMYALGLNPAREALMSDGLLDVLFLPASGTVGIAAWYCRAALSSLMRARGAVFRRGASIVVRGPRGANGGATSNFYQLDGDEGGVLAGIDAELRIWIRPGAARVLAGAGGFARTKTAPVR